ncbi:MAG TPA: hypothetical protein VLX68_15525 [Chitinivibrionales bacterium]|nr:hypothetical protein [Chitinivibrionales bacterium]
MTNGKVIWPPHPYKAGFCVTDDTDAATFEQITAVYDFLSSRHFLTTKTVWPFEPSDNCGIPPAPASTLRGVTLQDARYLDYCKKLRAMGYELCLHGASAGNNLRESTRKALEFLQRELGPSDTFICHSKNAENIYWNEKITSLFPFHQLLKAFSGFECSGETRTSPYFWGDMCRIAVNQIRLYRTRRINTLKKNPSMPYHCRQRPLVNGWFSATKRSLADCAGKEEQERLIRENGLTVLYQYLHRYAGPNGGSLKRSFTDAVESLLSNNALRIDTVSNTMKRLRLIQGVFILHERNRFWIVNTNTTPVDSLQVVFDRPVHLTSDLCAIETYHDTATIANLPANSIVRIVSDGAIALRGRRCFALTGRNLVRQKFEGATLYVNLSDSQWQASNGISVKPASFFLDAELSGTGFPLLSNLPLTEEVSLLLGQIWIIAREVLFKGRSLNSKKYLDDSKEILLENHDNW